MTTIGRFSRLTGAAGLAILFGLGLADATSERIQIGGSLSLTGSYAPLGQTQHRGFRLCIENANARGGVLGRSIELSIEDDQSRADIAVEVYRRHIVERNVDAVLGPYSSPITDAVAELTEAYEMPLVASGAASSTIFRKNRKFVFQVMSPTDVYFEGLFDLATRHGLQTVALVHQDSLFPRATVEGGEQIAKKMGLRVVAMESYPRGTRDFASVLAKVGSTNPDVIAAATYFDDAVAITQTLKKLNINPKMYGATVGVHLPKFYKTLGEDAEFVYGATQWEPQLMTTRAGGLIPMAREYPGAADFVTSYKNMFPDTPLSHLTAAAYAGCRVLLEGIRSADSLDGERIRTAISSMETNTVYGAFKVDRTGLQIAHKMMWFQWQQKNKIIVWPSELTPSGPFYPTPPWNER